MFYIQVKDKIIILRWTAGIQTNNAPEQEGGTPRPRSVLRVEETFRATKWLRRKGKETDVVD